MEKYSIELSDDAVRELLGALVAVCANQLNSPAKLTLSNVRKEDYCREIMEWVDDDQNYWWMMIEEFMPDIDLSAVKSRLRYLASERLLLSTV